MSKSLENKVCIVTGAGKGIGKEISELFYEEGAKLALITRSKEDISSLEKEFSNKKRSLFYVGDVSDEETARKFIEETNKKYKKIDVLINNAGMRFRKDFLDITLDEWNKVITNNLTSTYLMCREVGKSMVQQQSGKIVNLASVIGTQGLPQLAAYGASKGGIITLTKCLALEWANYNINVNAVAPGFCATSYAENFKNQKPELYKFTIERTPKKRWGTSRDVANACLFLSTKSSDYVTGTVLDVDGGWSAW